MSMEEYDRARAHALRMASHNNQALVQLVNMGIKLGDPVDPAPGIDCSSCEWHIVNEAENHEDGGIAVAIVSWVKEGYLGDPKNCVLHPVTR